MTVAATDATGNVARQAITVRVADRDDSAPVIGGAGAAAAEIRVAEGVTAVTTLLASEAVTWSLAGGTDAARFAIDPATGVLGFVAATDFENPADSDRDNAYAVRVRAVDGAGNEAFQSLTVRVGDTDEIATRLAEIGDSVRGGLRDHALHSLSDMLSFNENLLQARDAEDCAAPTAGKTLSGGLDADNASQQARLNWSKAFSGCGRPYTILLDAGLTSSRVAGNWTTRGLASARIERRLSAGTTIGLALMGSAADDRLPGFDTADIADRTLQLNGYLRTRLTGTLRAGAFGGFGCSWDDFAIVDDGLDLSGRATGDRHVYGAVLSGDLPVGGVLFTTDMIWSHAGERLGDATLAADYAGERRAGIGLPVGSVDLSRLSLPVSARFSMFDSGQAYGKATTVMLSSGLLCEDNTVLGSSWTCGYQFAGKVVALRGDRGRAYLDYRFEAVDSLRRNLIGLGYAYRFGRPLELSLDLNSGMSTDRGADHRAMVGLKIAP